MQQHIKSCKWSSFHSIMPKFSRGLFTKFALSFNIFTRKPIYNFHKVKFIFFNMNEILKCPTNVDELLTLKFIKVAKYLVQG